MTSPDEAHHELVGGVLVEVARAPDLLDPPVVHHHDLLGDLHRLLLVVGDEDRRHVDLVVEPPQPGAQLLADGRVERAERLVEQQHLGLDGERAGERHALALAARELRRGSDRRKPSRWTSSSSSFDAGVDLGLRTLADLEAEGDVLAHGHVLEGRVVLEDEADAALARGRGGRVRRRRSGRARRRAARGPAMTRRSVDLPLPLGPSSAVSSPSGTVERHVLERGEVAEVLGNVLDDDAHQLVPSLGLIRFITSSVAIARIARTTEAA